MLLLALLALALPRCVFSESSVQPHELLLALTRT
jgi:hypothetical protein